ncbi:sigma-70 family RNA polymerase sigma factor [Microbacteriaceae bacterium K1510]|nr:sigma-70 family RNA polymerase sigma factor [Microbacteriaceae bacterium K1510]
MSEATLIHLRKQLVAQYDEIKRRLVRRLGSDDLASEVLQETYLHLDRPATIGVVRSPVYYLVTVATNIARMRFRREKTWVSLDDVDEVFGLVDETADPGRSIDARLELEKLQRAFDEMPARRRRILFASRVEGLRLREIAAQLGISQRLVEMELKQALDHCAQRLDRETT